MFTRNLQDYVIAQDITNHLQVQKNDIVTISQAAWTQMSREKHFLTTVVVGGTLTACTMGLCTGFVGLGVVGSELGFGLTALEIAAGAGIAGGSVSAIGHKLTTDALVRKQTLDTVPFLGKVKRIDNKLFSELKHVEVTFFIPTADGFEKRTVWVDAHHLILLISKTEDAKRTYEIQRKAKEVQRKYDATLLEKHRAQFAPETISLQQEVNALKAKLSTTEQSLDSSKRVHWLFTLAPLLLLL